MIGAFGDFLILNRWQKVGILFFSTVIPFFTYFLRPDLIGNDGYAFALNVCQGFPLSMPPVAGVFFGFLFCDFLFFKFLLFLFAVVIVLLISLIGEEFFTNGWIAGLMVNLSPWFWVELFKFENDQFSYVFILIALYFLIRNEKIYEWQEKNNFFKWLPLGSVLGLGFLLFSAGIWAGALYLIPAFMLLDGIILLSALPILYFFGTKLLKSAMPVAGVMESNSWTVSPDQFIYTPNTLLFNFGLTFGIFHIPRKILIPAVFTFLLSLLNAKFFFLTIPFLAVGSVGFYNSLKDKNWHYILIGLMLAVNIFSPFLFVTQLPPTPTDWNAINQAVEDSNGHLQNDWYAGYWIIWAGGDTNNYAGIQAQNWENEGYILTSQNWFPWPCRLEWQIKDWNFYNCNREVV